MMPLFIRIVTGLLVIGGVAGIVWADSFLIAWVVAVWTVGLGYVGLALAADWEATT